MKTIYKKSKAALAALTAAAVMVSPAGIFAVGIDSVDINGDRLRVSGSADADGEILLNIINDGAAGGSADKILYMAQKAAENGKFTFEFNIKNAAAGAEGEFSAEVSDADSLEKRAFNYYSDATVDAVRERINAQVGKSSKDAAAIDALKEILTAEGGKLAAAYAPFDMCFENGAESSLLLLCELLSYEKSFADNDSLRAAIKKNSTIVLLGTCAAADTAENLERCIGGLGMDEKNSYKSYIKMTESERKSTTARLAKQARPFPNEKAFTRALDTAVMITVLGSKNGTDACAQVLAGYPEYFTLDKATSFHYKKIMKGINDGSVETIDEINKILAQKPSESGGTGGGSGSSGGSGGSSGGSGGNTVYSPQLPKPTDNAGTNTAAAGAEFADLDGYDWAREAIESLEKHGVICGYDKNTFAPGDSVTRAQLCKMICLAMSLNSYGGSGEFEDVSAADWHSGYIGTLSALGIVNGTSATRFEPDRFVTREEMAAIAYRALKAKNLAPTAEGEMKFADGDSISEFAAEAVHALAAEGLLNGDENGRFNAGANASRAETAKFVYSLCLRCGGIN